MSIHIWIVEKYSRLYPATNAIGSSQGQNQGPQGNQGWVYLADKPIKCELTEGVNDNDACFRVFALTPNEVNLEKLSFTSAQLLLKQLQAWRKGDVLYIKYVHTDGVRRFQLKFRGDGECTSCSAVLGRFVPVKTISPSVTSIHTLSSSQLGRNESQASSSTPYLPSPRQGMSQICTAPLTPLSQLRKPTPVLPNASGLSQPQSASPIIEGALPIGGTTAIVPPTPTATALPMAQNAVSSASSLTTPTTLEVPLPPEHGPQPQEMLIDITSMSDAGLTDLILRTLQSPDFIKFMQTA